MIHLKVLSVSLAFAFLIASVYISQQPSFTGAVTSPGETVQASGDVSQLQVPETEPAAAQQEADAGILVKSVSSDKELYHSAETMLLTAIVNCDSDMDGVTVTASGVNGRIDSVKTLDLKAGDNEVTFEHQLPSCNVCGGIRPGTYSCTVEASYGGTSSSASAEIEIQQ